MDDRSSWVRFQEGTGNFSLLRRVQTGSGAHLASYVIVTGGSSPVIKRPGREADRSRHSSAEVKESVALYLHPSMSSWRGA
jgi:hypothetical protein